MKGKAMSNNFSVTRLTEKNFSERIGELAVLFDKYRLFYKQNSNIDGARNFLEMRFRNNESVVFLGVEANQTVGFAQLYRSFTSVGMRDVWILNDLFVEGAKRRTGIAERLVIEAVHFARETGAVRVVLETATDNFQAQKLYDKLGFLRDAGMHHYSFTL